MAWELFKRDTNGYEVVGVDGELLEHAPVGALPIACEVTIDAASALPDALGETEMALEQVAAAVGGRIAGTIRSEVRLWTLVALPTDDDVQRFAEIPLPSDASISVAPTRDPGWTIFDRVRPTGMERQSLDDLRVVRALHDAGDTGGVRPIEHQVVGLPADLLDGFVASAASLGFRSTVRDDVAGALSVVVTHDADPTQLTADSWTLRQIAERHGASYDGWGCGVVRAGGPDRGRSPSDPSRRRGLFRRR